MVAIVRFPKETRDGRTFSDCRHLNPLGKQASASRLADSKLIPELEPPGVGKV